MSYEMKEGQGSLFKNDKKGNDKRPDYRGECLINGEKLEISAWIKEGKKGKFMSLSIKAPQERGSQDSKPAAKPQNDFADDDLDF